MDTILITGSNRGIGLGLTKTLLAGGHTVIAAARRPDESTELKALKKQHTNAITLLKCDVDDAAGVREAAKQLQKHHGRLDVIVNNAAIFPEEGDESILEMDLKLIERAFKTNVIGAARVVQSFGPLLLKSNRPRILNVSSSLGSISDKHDHGNYAYSISKAALNMFSRTCAAELRSKNAVVVAISPGWVRTDMGGKNADISVEESAEALAHAIATIGPDENGKFLDRHGKSGKYRW
jgi:NAD(P)-dependent dehydrogenase (short-subunit alcohol dehydrogenase family)